MTAADNDGPNFNAASGVTGGGGGGYVALREGTRLDGRYIVSAVLGAGGFGITYIAEHEALGTHYAIKENFPRQCAYRHPSSSQILPTEPQTFRWAHERFLDEGRRLAKCRHPNVVGVTNVFEENGTAYMVLEYEEGQTLLDWLAGLGRPPTQAEIDALLSPILDALAYVHGQGILHRDIAPDNIMIRKDGKPCLIDFGAAREAIAERSQALSALIKPGYSPLEQFSRDGRSQGPWSDIYALGATFYRVVLGRAPADAADRADNDDMRPLRELVPSPERYRASFLDGLDRALRVKQADRPQSVADWRQQLFAADAPPPAVQQVAPQPRSADPPDRSAPSPSTPAISFARSPLAAGILIALGAIGMGAAIMSRLPARDRPAQPSAEKQATAVVATPKPTVTAPQVSSAEKAAKAAEAASRSAVVETKAAPAASELPKAEPGSTPLPAAADATVSRPASPSTGAAGSKSASVAPRGKDGATASPPLDCCKATFDDFPLPERRIETGMCFNEFRSRAKARLPAATQDACAAACDARPGECDAWEYLDLSERKTNCALYAPAPATTLPCSAAGAGTANGAIGYRQ